MTTSNPTISSDTAAAAESAVNRAAEGAHAAVDRVAEKAGPAVENIRGRVNAAGEALHHTIEELDAMQERWLEECRGCVREHPILSVGVAIAAGMLLGRLLVR
ncbi:DUF883 family protein [Propionivibrio soli]|uniref:DUF883 family protein n=1 Tax=Propionivibrio soli TaxID=2976531 RepID=UPI0021E96E50|nr:hypothetical protein [Propionivibrio soli]